MDNTKNLKKIIKSSEWTYYGKNFCFPKHNTIAINTKTFAKASEVFKAMKLDMSELLEIFPAPQSNETPVTDYGELNCCQVSDKNGWLRLSQLTEKTIHFYLLEDSCMGNYVCTYLPNGKIKKIGLVPQLFHFLSKKLFQKINQALGTLFKSNPGKI